MFSSGADITGGNPDEGRELFLYDRGAAAFTQVTNDAEDPISIDCSLNGNGSWAAFEEDRNLTGENLNGNQEIMLIGLPPTPLK